LAQGKPLSHLTFPSLAISAFLAQKRILWSADPYGSVNMLYSATSPEVMDQNMSGNHIVPWVQVYPPHPDRENVEMAQKLWVWLNEQEKEHLR